MIFGGIPPKLQIVVFLMKLDRFYPGGCGGWNLMIFGRILPKLQIVMFFNEIGWILSRQLWLVESDDIWRVLAKA